jgi:hypothetical protein
MLFIFIAQAIPGNPFVLDYLRKFAAEHEGQGLSSIGQLRMVCTNSCYFQLQAP